MEISDFKAQCGKMCDAINNFELPQWDELPKIYLYMDQVIELVSEYFKSFSDIASGEKPLTSPMINNYVKLRAMPPPEKKRYSRVHLAYLIMITAMKQSVSIASMKKIIPVCTDEEKVKEIYASFSQCLKNALKALDESIGKVSGEDAGSEEAFIRLVVCANFMNLFIGGITSGKNEEASSDKKETLHE